jgi:hypothetical protein
VVQRALRYSHTWQHVCFLRSTSDELKLTSAQRRIRVWCTIVAAAVLLFHQLPCSFALLVLNGRCCGIGDDAPSRFPLSAPTSHRYVQRNVERAQQPSSLSVLSGAVCVLPSGLLVEAAVLLSGAHTKSQVSGEPAEADVANTHPLRCTSCRPHHQPAPPGPRWRLLHTREEVPMRQRQRQRGRLSTEPGSGGRRRWRHPALACWQLGGP